MFTLSSAAIVPSLGLREPDFHTPINTMPRCLDDRKSPVLPGFTKTPMVEKTAGVAAEYGKGDIEEMWKVRDAQCPMGHMGDAWGDAWGDAYACLYLASDESNWLLTVGSRLRSVERFPAGLPA
jgi:hypothetical protein